MLFVCEPAVVGLQPPDMPINEPATVFRTNPFRNTPDTAFVDYASTQANGMFVVDVAPNSTLSCRHGVGASGAAVIAELPPFYKNAVTDIVSGGPLTNNATCDAEPDATIPQLTVHSVQDDSNGDTCVSFPIPSRRDASGAVIAASKEPLFIQTIDLTTGEVSLQEITVQ